MGPFSCPLGSPLRGPPCGPPPAGAYRDPRPSPTGAPLQGQPVAEGRSKALPGWLRLRLAHCFLLSACFGLILNFWAGVGGGFGWILLSFAMILVGFGLILFDFNWIWFDFIWICFDFW